MLDPFASTIPNTASFRWICAQRGLEDPKGPAFYTQMNFITSGDFIPGTTSIGLAIAWSNYFFLPLLPYNFFPVQLALGSNTINTPSGVHVGQGGSGATGWITGPGYLPLEGCATITLNSTNPTRQGRGLFRIPGLSPARYDGDYVSETLKTDVIPLLAYFTTPWTFAGVTFTPAVWSRAANGMWPITSAILNQRITRFHKRRPWRQNVNPFIMPTPNW